jgi:hypothetical protein
MLAKYAQNAKAAIEKAVIQSTLCAPNDAAFASIELRDEVCDLLGLRKNQKMFMPSPQ